jgi:hypothetical protein
MAIGVAVHQASPDLEKWLQETMAGFAPSSPGRQTT